MNTPSHIKQLQNHLFKIHKIMWENMVIMPKEYHLVETRKLIKKELENIVSCKIIVNEMGLLAIKFTLADTRKMEISLDAKSRGKEGDIIFPKNLKLLIFKCDDEILYRIKI